LFIMPAIPILIVLAMVILWFAFSPLFRRLGGKISGISSYVKKEMSEEDETRIGPRPIKRD